MIRRLWLGFLLLAITGCAGWNKTCSQVGASNFGSNWIVAQYDMSGRPFHCWKLQNVSLKSGQGGNVDWQETSGSNHLVYITGWENRVQVNRGDWTGAGRIIGVDADKCGNGVYPKDGQ